MSAVFKQQAHKLVDALPESAARDELAEKARFLAGVEQRHFQWFVPVDAQGPLDAGLVMCPVEGRNY